MPYTGIVLSILSIVFGAFLILLCHWLTAAGLMVRSVDACEAQYQQRPIRATLIGLFTFGPVLLLTFSAAKFPGAAPAIILTIGIVSLLLAFIGSAGLVLKLGNGLCPESGRWERSLRGGTMLGLCCITPFVGWFVVLPLTLCSGFGAMLLARPWKTSKTARAPINAEPALS